MTDAQKRIARAKELDAFFAPPEKLCGTERMVEMRGLLPGLIADLEKALAQIAQAERDKAALRDRIEGLQRWECSSSYDSGQMYRAHDGDYLERSDVLALFDAPPASDPAAALQPRDDFEQPKMNCPKCGKEYEDFDGVGVVYCAPPDGCGFCRHLARTGRKCDFCGDVEDEQPIEGEAGSARCRFEGCTSTATHGPDGKAVVCWSHAGDWPEAAREGEAKKAQLAKNSNGDVIGTTKPAWLLELDRLRAFSAKREHHKANCLAIVCPKADIAALRTVLPQLEELATLRRVVLEGKGEAPIPEWAAKRFGTNAKSSQTGWSLQGTAGEWVHIHHSICIDFATKKAWALDSIDAAGAEILAAHRDTKPENIP